MPFYPVNGFVVILKVHFRPSHFQDMMYTKGTVSKHIIIPNFTFRPSHRHHNIRFDQGLIPYETKIVNLRWQKSSEKLFDFGSKIFFGSNSKSFSLTSRVVMITWKCWIRGSRSSSNHFVPSSRLCMFVLCVNLHVTKHDRPCLVRKYKSLVMFHHISIMFRCLGFFYARGHRPTVLAINVTTLCLA